jgi:hypothetical protein
MKTKILLISLLIASGSQYSFSQNDSTQKKDEIKTIFHRKKGSNGGYASLWVGYTQIDHKDGFAYGVNAAWLIGHSLGIGIAGAGFSNDYYLGHNSGSNVKSLMGGYGGFLIEPVIIPKYPVHVSFPVLLGAGYVASMNSYYWGDWENENYMEEGTIFMVVEPGIDIELNLLKHLRLGVGAKYRFTFGDGLDSYSKKVLDGYTLSLALKFGKF